MKAAKGGIGGDKNDEPVLIWVLAYRRAHHTNHALRHNYGQLPGGGLLLLLAAIPTAGAAFGLLYVSHSAAVLEKALAPTPRTRRLRQPILAGSPVGDDQDGI